MAIFGWVCALIILSFSSIGLGFIIFNCVGKYNIGGVPNDLADKLGGWFLVALIVFAWYALATHAPFSVTIN
jgi:hypothetical protein